MNLRVGPVKLATEDKDAPSATTISSVDSAELDYAFAMYQTFEG